MRYHRHFLFHYVSCKCPPRLCWVARTRNVQFSRTLAHKSSWIWWMDFRKHHKKETNGVKFTSQMVVQNVQSPWAVWHSVLLTLHVVDVHIILFRPKEVVNHLHKAHAVDVDCLRNVVLLEIWTVMESKCDIFSIN